jgi:hypothetical protein
MDQPDRPYPFPLTIPPGGFATVRGTKQHQELLARVLGRQQEALVGVRLAVADLDPARPKAGGPVLMVELDGITVGAVSAKDSALRVPIVRQLTDMGRDALALARVRPSSGQQGGLICSVSAFTIEPPTVVS